MAEICLRHDMLICSDEIHCDLIYSGHRHIPIASLDPEISKNTITLMAPSKTYNLAGLQCSFAIIQNAELRKRYQAARGGLVPWVNLMGMIAAQSAYLHGNSWLAQLLEYLEANRDFLCETVARELPGVKMGQPEGHTWPGWIAGKPRSHTTPANTFWKRVVWRLTMGRHSAKEARVLCV